MFALGVFLVLLGSVFFIVSSISRYGKAEVIVKAGVFLLGSNPVDNSTVEIPRIDNSTWELSANFSKGDYLLVRINPSYTWAPPPEEEPGAYEMSDLYPGLLLRFAMLELYPPDGNKTVIEIVLAKAPNQQSLAMVDLKLIKNSDGLEIENSSNGLVELHGTEFIGGITQFDGEYTVKVLPYIYPPTSPDWETKPPAWFSLHKSTRESPFFWLLPVGCASTLSGLGLFFAWRKK